MTCLLCLTCVPHVLVCVSSSHLVTSEMLNKRKAGGHRSRWIMENPACFICHPSTVYLLTLFSYLPTLLSFAQPADTSAATRGSGY